MELKEFAEYLVKSIAKEPDMVSVQIPTITSSMQIRKMF